MAIAFVASASSVDGSGAATSLTITKPTGAASGDVAVMVALARGGSGQTISATGWTAAISTLNTGAGTGELAFRVFYKVLGGSEPGSYSFTLGSAAVCSGGISVYSGVDNTTPMDVTASTVANTSTGTSVITPSITTVTANAWLVQCVGINSGSTTITEPGSWNERFEVTSSLRSQNSDAVQASAGASGAKTATLSAARTNAGALLALRPGGATPATLKWSKPGYATSSTQTITVRTDIASTNVRLRYSTASDLSGYTEIGPQTTDSGGHYYTKFSLSGLSAGTQYYYAPVVDGTQSGSTGAFKTAPTNGSAWSGVIAFGCCRNTGSTSGVYARILTRSPELFIDLGDLHYSDISASTESLFHDAFDNSLGISQQNALYRATNGLYIPDDHDGGPNGRDKTQSNLATMIAAYQRAIPHPTLPGIVAGNNALYHSVVRGRVRIIVTDVRNERDPVANTDNSSKSTLGTAQKQWLKDEMFAAKVAGQVIIWVNPYPWIGTTGNSDDSWPFYSTERTELADYIQSNGLISRIIMLGGDGHMLAFDDGTNSNYATSPSGNGFPVYHAAPIHQNPSTKGGPYSGGTVETADQFGILTITDSGGATIGVQFDGIDVDDDIVLTHSTTLQANAVGALTATQAAQSASAAGVVAIAGASALTQADQTSAGAGAVAVIGASANTQAAQTVAATGAVAIIGASATTQANQTSAATGVVAIAGALAAAQADHTLTASSGATAIGALAATQDAQSSSASGTVAIAGALAASQASNTLTAEGEGAAENTGAAALAQAAHTISASGGVAITGQSIVIQADNVASAAGTVAIVGAASLTQAANSLSAAGGGAPDVETPATRIYAIAADARDYTPPVDRRTYEGR